MSRSDGVRPGFLVVALDSDGTYVGGLMVTDVHGLPLDFRYTDPITPTRLQRALYGGALDRYLRADVVARTLLGAVSEAPTALLLDDERLLGAVRAECPVGAVIRTNLPPVGDRGTIGGDQEDGAFLVQTVHGDPPLRVIVEGEAGSLPQTIADLGESMDPTEPMQRVRAALELIAAGEAA